LKGSASDIRITLLGFPQLERSGAVVALPRRRTRALLYYLAADPQPHSREELTEIFWGHLDPGKGRRQLSDALTDLRRTLGEGCVVRDRASVAWDGPDADVVQLQFQLDAVNREEGNEEAGDFLAAANLYGGEFLAGVTVEQSESFQEWLDTQRTRIAIDVVDAFSRAAWLLLDSGDADGAIEAASRGLAVDELREDLWRCLMESRAAKGDREGALREYEHCREVMKRELGVAPDAEVQALRRRLSADPGSTGSGTREVPAARARPPLPLSLRLPPGSLPLTGRQRELGALLRRWQEAMNGNGGMALIVGEPGIGKSRLAAEFASRAAADGAIVLGGRCPDLVDAPPYGPVEEALRAGLPLVQPGALATLGKEWLPWAGRLLPEVGWGAGVAEKLSPEEERSRLAEASSRLLDVISGERPLLLVIEDLHWSHPSSVSLLHHIARRKKRVLVLATFRDTELETAASATLQRAAGDLTRNGLLERIDLEPLPRADAEALVRVALTTASTKVKIRPGPLAALSEGHPLFMLELMRSLLEAPDDPDLPESLTSTIQARVERTSEYARRVLELSVVFGEAVSPTLLARASGVEPTDEPLVSAVEELMSRRLMREEDEATASYCVSHGLVGTAIYRSLSGVRRRALHARAAAALDCAAEHESGARVESLVRHYKMAGEVVRAAEKCMEAGDRAWDLAEPGTAITRYNMAADLYSRAGLRMDAARAWEKAGDAGVYECAMAGAGDAFTSALAIAEEGDDTPLRARLHRKLAEAHTRWGYGGLARWQGASLHIDKAVELTERDAREEWSRILAARSFLRSALCMGEDNPHTDPEAGEHDAKEAVRLADGSVRAWLQAMDALCTQLIYAGRREEALECILERIPVATKLGDAHELHDALRMAAYTYKLLGDPVAMERCALQSEEVVVAAELDISVVYSRAVRADALCLQGRWVEAVDLLAVLIDDPLTLSVPTTRSTFLLLAAEARAHLGEVDQARALMAEAMAEQAFDPDGFFAWGRDAQERAEKAVEALSLSGAEPSARQA
jgi:DNA-binding SARP family transcriptional activator